ncbi:MAG: hydantoinase/oxoprolinase family protein, partial [Desulfatiglandaceae bacterium]
TCTTVMNGYLGPVIRDYMDNLTAHLKEEFGELTLHIMQSNGGTMTADVAKDHASHLINSGPAGGAIAAAFVSRRTENEMAVGADMGGTTFDISIIDHNLPKTTTWGGVTNYPIKLPMVDLKTIGAGGGSIAWVDQGGVLNVGPQSAGSDPGPAGYGWGGSLPTVSDANLILGRLNPDYFLGGKLPLYPGKAIAAIREHVATPMDLTVEEAAAGIIRIVNANMAKGISGNSVERGYDLREFSLITMGGAAGLHAAEITRELSMARVIVPAMSGNFSAVGMVVADIQHDYVHTYARRHPDIDPVDLMNRFKEMEEEGKDQLRQEKVPEDRMEITWSADLRYEGQSWELNTAIPAFHVIEEEDIIKIAKDFHSLHQQVYSYSEPDEVVEFMNLRVRVKGKNLPLTMEEEEPCETFNMIEGRKAVRPIYFEGSGWQDTPVYERESLSAGALVSGPCIIEETISTALIPHGFTGVIDSFGNIIMTQDPRE